MIDFIDEIINGKINTPEQLFELIDMKDELSPAEFYFFCLSFSERYLYAYLLDTTKVDLDSVFAEDGWTNLMLMACSPNGVKNKAAEYLIFMGADWNELKNNKGQTAYDIAIEHNNTELVKFMNGQRSYYD